MGVFHRVVKADWSSQQARWTVQVDADGDRRLFTCDFLFLCSGYYDYAQGHAPEFPGRDSFAGRIVHPQHWPADLSCAGRKVVVIGSGATAVTLLPELAAQAAHVTMLQRSPSYWLAPPLTNELAVTLRALDIPDEWTHEILRRAYSAEFDELARLAHEAPDELHDFLMESMKPLLPEGFKAELVAEGIEAATVVAMMAAVQRPERKVQRPGQGTTTPNSSRRPAKRHQRATVRNVSIPTVDAATLTGSSVKPETAPPSMPGTRPLESALVSAL